VSPQAKKIISAILVASTVVVPLFASAQNQLPQPPNAIALNGEKIAAILWQILTLVWAGAVVFVIIAFIIIGSHFLLTKGEPEKFKDARNALIYAIVGVAVMVLAWSIVTVVASFILNGGGLGK